MKQNGRPQTTAILRSGPRAAAFLGGLDNVRSVGISGFHYECYRKLPVFCITTKLQNRAIAISPCKSSLRGFGGSQMGRKPKTTGPTARGNPEAFKQILTRMGLMVGERFGC
jgi:hypothetical protein